MDNDTSTIFNLNICLPRIKLFFRHTHYCAARSDIFLHLIASGVNRLTYPLQGRFTQSLYFAFRHGNTTWRLIDSGCLAYKLFHHTILERMKANDHGTTAGPQGVGQSFQHTVQTS